MDGCLDKPKTSAPRLKTFVATYWFAPLIRLTTAITEVTLMTTPSSVRTLRSLWAQRLAVAISTASARFIVERRAMYGGARVPHATIRTRGSAYYTHPCRGCTYRPF